MKPRIFNARIIALVALVATSIVSFAQEAARPYIKVTPKVSVKSITTTAYTSDVKSVTMPETLILISPDVNVASEINGVKPCVEVKDCSKPKARVTALVADKKATVRKVIRINRTKSRTAQRITIRNGNMELQDPDTPDNSYTNTYPTPVVGYGSNEQDYQDTGTEMVKNYTKTYTADADDKLQIENSYGDVTVNTWNRNEFKIQVKITVNTSSDVTITDSKKGSVVSFKTNIKKQGGGTWLRLGKASHDIMVNYIVYMPAKNALDITNSYGAINLPDLNGRVVVNGSYGSLVARSLNGEGSIINLNYCSSSIESLKESDVNVEYGSLVLTSADKLNANISYAATNIGRIGVTGNINIKYGPNFKINDISKGLKNLTINSDYTTVKVGINGDENADFDVTVKNGNFSYGKHAVYIPTKAPAESKKWSPTQNYRGYLGKGNVNKVININSTYGTVKFD
jgi:hypothetical protein